MLPQNSCSRVAGFSGILARRIGVSAGLFLLCAGFAAAQAPVIGTAPPGSYTPGTNWTPRLQQNATDDVIFPNSAIAQQMSSHTVTLDIAVVGKDAHEPAPPITAADVTILDNRRPVKIVTFRRLDPALEPTRVVIVVDQLNVETRGLSNEQAQVVHFLRSQQGPLPFPTALGVLTQKGLELQPTFSTDGHLLADSLDKLGLSLRTLTNHTGFYGAAERQQISLNALGGLVARLASLPGRKAILWVSPGWPILSGPDIMLSGDEQNAIFHQAVAFSDGMRIGHITLDAIDPVGPVESVGRELYYEDFLDGASKPSQAQLGDIALQVLAIQSGGRAVNSNDAAATIADSYAALKGNYEAAFQMPEGESPNEYNRLTVKLDQPDLTARTRTIYYAAP